MQYSIRSINTLLEIPAAAWNRLNPAGHPFLRHEFLAGLEKFRCLDDHGWHPAHLIVTAENEIAGALPLYFKSNSTGEFVFDWSWAEAYERAGGQYYPKLVSAIPFSPVTGPRCLVRDDQNRNEITLLLISTALQLVEETQVSGLHFLFPDESEAFVLQQHGLLLRKGCQYHWHNHGYRDFDDFLDQLNSKRRKEIKRERRAVHEAGIEIEILHGREITSRHWEAFYPFYTSTFERKWGEPRLTLPFFESLSDSLPEATLLFLAKKGNTYVAGALALQGPEILYGRHWGCRQQFPFLHFELCYYQTIEYCIRQRLEKLDAGAQGEHKISRGFVPVSTWSAHWLAHDQFRAAIADFLERERKHIDRYMNNISTHTAYRTGVHA